MPYTTVAILTPGDMGHSVGNVLRHGGLRVITCLQGRSARTASLAAEAGIENVADYETLVHEAEIILSILAPSAAGEVALRVADAVRATSTHPVFVECNAIAPQTVRGLAAVLTSARGAFRGRWHHRRPSAARQPRHSVLCVGRARLRVQSTDEQWA